MKKELVLFIGLFFTAYFTANAQLTNIKRLTNVRDSYPNPSPDGSTIVFQSNRSGSSQLYICDTAGNNIKQITFSKKGENQCPVFSPDGNKIVFVSTRDDEEGDVFIIDKDGSNEKKLTPNKGDDSHPHWSPDGKKIIFNSARTTPDLSKPWSEQYNEIFLMNPDGTGIQQITSLKTISTYPNISPDGKMVVFRRVDNSPGLNWELSETKRNSEIYVMNIDGTNIVNISNNAAFDGWPCWSPDSKSVVFASNRSGPALVSQLYIVDKDGKNLKRITSTSSGGYSQPSWRSGGRIYAYQGFEGADYEYGNIVVVVIP